MATTLIFDIIITGHHAEYIEHVVDYLIKKPDERTYIVITHPDFPSRFPDIVRKANADNRIQLFGITTKELQMSESGNLLIRSFSWYKLVNQYASQYKADHVLLLYFNLFQLPLAFFRPKYRVSGILFLQFYRMAIDNWKERLKYRRKYWVTKFFSRNPKIHKVYVLNDYTTVTFLNTEFGTNIFDVLHDPIADLQPEAGFNIYEHYRIDRERKILLHLGALSDRKGTLEFIRSALFIKTELQSEFAFLVAGSPGGAKMSERITNEINQATAASRVKIIYDYRFLPNGQMKSMLDQCFGIVIPYKNPEASSGILGHAAASKKPIITTGKGLLKELVEVYRLGLLVDEVEPTHIASKIGALLDYNDGQSAAAKFVAERTADRFAATIIS